MHGLPIEAINFSTKLAAAGVSLENCSVELEIFQCWWPNFHYFEWGGVQAKQAILPITQLFEVHLIIAIIDDNATDHH